MRFYITSGCANCRHAHCISFFCGGVIPYFILGALFMRYRRQQSGLDLVPNREFWGGLPSLVRDGFSFTWSKLRGQEASYSTLK